jgi:hypothetical protein
MSFYMKGIIFDLWNLVGVGKGTVLLHPPAISVFYGIALYQLL